MKKYRTRFAPSPTGFLHIGGLRTAAYAYALAKHNNGDFILRIEDTDQKRKIEGGVEKIKETLSLFDLDWDEFYVQSQRKEDGVYQRYAEKLVHDGHAFYCQCQAKNAKERGYSKILRDPCRDNKLTSGAIKLKVPDGQKISYQDFVIKKEISWNTSDVADTTLLKSDGFPTYHLAVVVDDSEMEISHVLRGHDWLPSTPIHLLVYKFLEIELPEIGHLTDILDPDGGKLSKRKGSVSVEGMMNDGYLPQALFNFVILLGWAPKDDRELFSLEEFVRVFEADGFQKSNPVFNRDKLDWFNGEYIRKTPNLKLITQIYDFYKGNYHEKFIETVLPLVKERINKLSEFENLAGFFMKEREVDKALFETDWEKHIKGAQEALGKLNEFELDKINNTLIDVIDKNSFKTGKFFMNLRIAITGSKVTPPINESIEILGKKETLNRLEKVLK